jgi:hypothetical protein
MRNMILWLLPLFALAGLSGCIFSPDRGGGGGPPKPPPTYPIRKDPQQALENMLTAYGVRDSAEYLKVFARAAAGKEGYFGSSYDVNDSMPGNQLGTFTIVEEEQHIKKLAESRDIYRITLNFGSRGTWTRYGATGPSGERWAEIVITNPVIELDADNSYALKSNEIFTYQFSPDTSSASPTDTIWSIVRWFEAGP